MKLLMLCVGILICIICLIMSVTLIVYGFTLSGWQSLIAVGASLGWLFAARMTAKRLP